MKTYLSNQNVNFTTKVFFKNAFSFEYINILEKETIYNKSSHIFCYVFLKCFYT